MIHRTALFAVVLSSSAFAQAPTPSPTPFCVPEWVWLERILPSAAESETPIVVRFRLAGGTASLTAATETIPAGWMVIGASGWEAAPLDPDAGEGTILTLKGSAALSTYTISAPSGLPSGAYVFEGTSESWHWCNGTVISQTGGDDAILLENPRTSSVESWEFYGQRAWASLTMPARD